jgi:acetyl esterase/lipase
LYASVAERLLPEGYVVIVPDYTLYPAAGFPRQSSEVAAAIAWTLRNVARFGGDPQRVVVVSQSAGSQIAALATFNPCFLARHGCSPANLRGFVGISGVYDIPAQIAHERLKGRTGRYVVNVMGGWANLRAASPIFHVGTTTLPSLLIHGDADVTVPVSMSVALHRRLQQLGKESRLRIYPGGGHSAILFEALSQRPARLLTDILDFVRHVTSRREEKASNTSASLVAAPSRPLLPAHPDRQDPATAA